MTAIRVGLGTTLLERAQQGVKLDGIGVYVSSLYRDLRRSPEVRVLTASFPRKPWQAGLPPPSPRASARFGCAYGIGSTISALTGLPFTGGGRIGRDIDIFHAPDHLIPKLRTVPVVATICDALPVKRPDWINAGPGNFRSKLAKISAGWADHVIAISAAMVPDLVEHLGVPEKSISVVHLGVGQEWFDRVADEERRAALTKYRLKPGYFLFVGTLQPRKNLEAIMSAYEALPAAIRMTRQLVIAGQAGWGSEPLVRKLRSMDQSVCRWLEYVPAADLRALYQQAGAFVFPSLWEGFGIPVLEAFASGVPVITSNVASLPEIAGDAAIVVDPRSVAEIRDAMSRLSSDPSHAATLAGRGRERARQMSWDICARKTVDVYRKLI